MLRGIFNPLSSFQPSYRDRKELVKLNTMFMKLLRRGKVITQDDVRKLLRQVTRDRKITPEEMSLLAQGFSQNQHMFNPMAAMAMHQFLTTAPALPGGWIPPGGGGWIPPGGGYPPSMPMGPMGSMGPWSVAMPGEPRDVKALRQSIHQAFTKNRPVNAKEAQALVTRALANPAIGLRILSDAFYYSPQAFDPQAQQRIQLALAQYGMGAYF